MVIMAGMDYKTAGVEVRERFAISAEDVPGFLESARGWPGVEGAVLLSTCNRLELYLTCPDDFNPEPIALISTLTRVELETCSAAFVVRRGRPAEKHLMMVAAGLRSQIRGEDQILAQVKTAIDRAREAGAADAVLETLFRYAVSGGKKAKTLVALPAVERSVAGRALAVLSGEMQLPGSRALVVGNGEMGRCMAELLRDNGAQVTVTLRSYKRGAAVAPAGCDSVPYAERYTAVAASDLVVSATASPHYTLRAEELQQLGRLPTRFVDLAVPRDIEPEVATLPGVRCWNVDDLGGNQPGSESREKLLQIRGILEEQLGRYDKWRAYRASLAVVK